MSVLKKPLVTEKVSALNEKGKYGFIVDIKANKVEIRKEVERVYGVNVVSVKTLRYSGKRKTRYTKAGILSGKKDNFKKAIVSLSEGEVIDFYGSI
jgi:large subunit ribosomal protein L23